MNHFFNSIIYWFAFFPELINLPRCISPMWTHHRRKRTELQPTHIQFLIHRILGGTSVIPTLIIVSGKEATNIWIEVRISGKSKIQACRNLIAQWFPRRTDISRPYIGSVTLLSGKNRTCKNKDAFIWSYGTLIIINATHRQQRISITHLAERPQIGLRIKILRLPIEMVRFRRIHPPAVHTQLEDTFIQVFPIDITGFRIIGIVYAYSGRIFHIGRPSIESRLGPCRKVKQHTILV